MPHRMRLLAACCISMAAVAAFAPDTGSGSGGASTKAAKDPAPAKDAAAKDLVQQAQDAGGEPSSTPGADTAELGAEVAEQLRLAGENLEAARAEVTRLQGELEQANAEGDDLAKEVADLRGQLAKARADLAAAKAAKGKAAAAEVAAEAARVQPVLVTVLKGRVTHSDAPDGKAPQGSSFVAMVDSADHAEQLERLAARGVIELSRAE